MSQLEDIMRVYLIAKEIPANPHHLTDYVIEYFDLRYAGLQHQVAIQKLKMDYIPPYQP